MFSFAPRRGTLFCFPVLLDNSGSCVTRAFSTQSVLAETPLNRLRCTRKGHVRQVPAPTSRPWRHRRGRGEFKVKSKKLKP